MKYNKANNIYGNERTVAYEKDIEYLGCGYYICRNAYDLYGMRF